MRDVETRRWPLLAVLFLTLSLGLASEARAQTAEQVQGPPRLDVVVTDTTPLTLSNKLGASATIRTNDTGGMFALMGQASLLVRRQSGNALERLWQYGDPVPGVVGSKSDLNFLEWFVSGSSVLFYADFLHPGGETQGAILRHDGSALRTIVTGFDTAPGTGGRRYERFARPLHLSATGDVWFYATLAPSGQTAANTVFVARQGMSPTRVVGPGDAAPGGGTFDSLTLSGRQAVNEAGQLAFEAVVGGVSGAFLWTGTGVQSIATAGQVVGGVTLSPVSTVWISGGGDVVFQSAGHLFRKPASGAVERLIGTGDTTPGLAGIVGTLANITSAESGAVAFTASITGAGSITSGVFVIPAGGAAALVAHRGQATQTGGPTLGNFSSISLNSSATVSFVATLSTGVTGVFQKRLTAALGTMLTTNQSATGGGTFSGFQGTVTVGDGAVRTAASISGGPSYSAQVVATSAGAVEALLTTDDELPAGGRRVIRQLFATAAGRTIPFRAQLAGGRISLFVADALTQQVSHMMTEGDAVPGEPGVFATSLNLQALQVGASGVVAWPASSTIVAYTPGVGLQKVVRSEDLDSASIGIVGPTLQDGGGPSRHVSAQGQVLFHASGTGVYLATPGAAALNVARGTQETSGGGQLVGSFQAIAVNSAGHVLFKANSRVGSESSGGVSRFFVGSPGTTPVKIVGIGDASPAGGTFTAIAALPGFNGHGEMAFKATVSGGPGGIFIVGPSTPLAAIALQGAPAPGGGTFSMTGTHLDVQINDQRDVVFLADLANSTADSGYFIRRGAAGALQALVRQGQTAPGTSLTFGTFPHTLNSRYGEFFQLSDTGEVAFQGRAVPPATLPLLGYWHARRDGTIEPLVIRTQAPDGLGGSTALSISQSSSWMDNSRYLITIDAGGGSVGYALAAFTPAPRVSVQPADTTVALGASASFTVAVSTPSSPTYRWEEAPGAGVSFSPITNGGAYSGATSATLTITNVASGLSGRLYRVIVSHGPATTTTRAASLTASAPPALATTPTSLRFAATKNGAGGELISVTAAQTVTVTPTGLPSAQWTATSNQPWALVSNGTGTGAGTFFVSVGNPANVIGVSTSLSATITLAAPNAGTSATVSITLTVTQQAGTTTAPIGQVDTPIQASTGAQGAIAMTGWVVDDVGVQHVRIYRQCLAFDNPAACQTVLGQNVVLVGEASVIAGARPDVEGLYPTLPAANSAGWGFLILSNLLPNIPASSSSGGGVGTFTLFAVATDVEGNQKLLGRTVNDATPTTVTVANDTIAKPFGAIDTPGQGATVSGTLNNFGWTLTPDSNTVADAGDILVPTAGATINVFIDGASVGTATYNLCRGSVGNPVPPGVLCDDDVSSIFRGAGVYRNLDAARGAIALRTISTTALTNGLHTISWGVTDSANRSEGIGSRYFNVLNSAGDGGPEGRALHQAQAGRRAWPSGPPSDHAALRSVTPIYARTGFDLSRAFVPLQPDEAGVPQVRIPELGRIELQMPGVVDGTLIVNGEARPLPVGVGIDRERGIVTWVAGPGYLGTYRLRFAVVRSAECDVRAECEVQPADVDVVVAPAPTADQPVRMHLDALHPAPRTSHFTLEGWALDPQAATGSGIGAVHVWAQRRSVARSGVEERDPVFLGLAQLDVARPDVAAAHGAQFPYAGFTFTGVLPDAGEWEVTAYVWVTRTGRFEDARTVTLQTSRDNHTLATIALHDHE